MRISILKIDYDLCMALVCVGQSLDNYRDIQIVFLTDADSPQLLTDGEYPDWIEVSLRPGHSFRVSGPNRHRWRIYCLTYRPELERPERCPWPSLAKPCGQEQGKTKHQLRFSPIPNLACKTPIIELIIAGSFLNMNLLILFSRCAFWNRFRGLGCYQRSRLCAKSVTFERSRNRNNWWPILVWILRLRNLASLKRPGFICQKGVPQPLVGRFLPLPSLLSVSARKGSL